jgi:hypothetical protein
MALDRIPEHMIDQNFVQKVDDNTTSLAENATFLDSYILAGETTADNALERAFTYATTNNRKAILCKGNYLFNSSHTIPNGIIIYANGHKGATFEYTDKNTTTFLTVSNDPSAQAPIIKNIEIKGSSSSMGLATGLKVKSDTWGSKVILDNVRFEKFYTALELSNSFRCEIKAEIWGCITGLRLTTTDVLYNLNDLNVFRQLRFNWCNVAIEMRDCMGNTFINPSFEDCDIAISTFDKQSLSQSNVFITPYFEKIRKFITTNRKYNPDTLQVSGETGLKIRPLLNSISFINVARTVTSAPTVIDPLIDPFLSKYWTMGDNTKELEELFTPKITMTNWLRQTDFSDASMTYWGVSNGTVAYETSTDWEVKSNGKIAHLTAAAVTGRLWSKPRDLSNNIVNLVTGHKYLLGVYSKTTGTNGDIFYDVGDATTGVSIITKENYAMIGATNKWNWTFDTFTVNSDVASLLVIYAGNASTIQERYFGRVFLVDLTALFGSDSPSLETILRLKRLIKHSLTDVTIGYS